MRDPRQDSLFERHPGGSLIEAPSGREALARMLDQADRGPKGPYDRSDPVDPDFRLVLTSLMEALADRLPELNRIDHTGYLRRCYERFRHALEDSGFRLEKSRDRYVRAVAERRLGELAEARGDLEGAIAHYQRALKSKADIGCRQRLEQLLRRTTPIRSAC